MNKIDKLSKEIGYKEIKVLVSKDYTKLKVNEDIFDLNMIETATVEVKHHDTVKQVTHEEENYNFFKGHIIAEVIDDPIGYLGGIETTEYYEIIEIKRVEFVLHFKNKLIKRYVAGIFISTDFNLEFCIEDTELNCKKVLGSINKCPNYDEVMITEDTSIFGSILSDLWWLIKTSFMIIMVICFFPFSLIYLWLKYRKKK